MSENFIVVIKELDGDLLHSIIMCFFVTEERMYYTTLYRDTISALRPMPQILILEITE